VLKEQMIKPKVLECLSIGACGFAVLVVCPYKMPNAFQQPSMYSIGMSMALPRKVRMSAGISSGGCDTLWDGHWGLGGEDGIFQPSS
jgi:hypothetical protein